MKKLYSNSTDIPTDLMKPSAAYKWHAWLAMLSLMTFVVFYFALASWFAWTAYRLFADMTFRFEDVLVGSCVGFLSVFMFKALFFIKRSDLENTIEITRDNDPQLFNFLDTLATEVGAPKPKRVYLSANVNAMVFYDLSIFNLLFPSHKNLEIGLALVNVLSVSEMKAVLAHEFGHFSQRSMAIGIWVYIAQQIASHLINKRDALDDLIKVISNIHLYVAWIGWILSLIVWSIRSLLDSLLRFVVLAQRSLSRQMEFHADLVAVSLTGSDELIHALHKLQAADEAWDRTFSFARSELNRGRTIEDIFDIQERIIKKIALIMGDADYGTTPVLPTKNREQHRIFKNDLVQPPKMWATHPSNADREENAKRHYLASNHDARSAWTLFKQSQKLKESVTAQLLATDQETMLSKSLTDKALDEDYALLQYDPRYRGSYLSRSLTRYALNAEALYHANELKNAVLQHNEIEIELSKLYPMELKDDLNNLRSLETEYSNLKGFRNSVYGTGKITFRGREISRRGLSTAIAQVQQELEQVRKKVIAHDQQCRTAHLFAAQKLGNGWYEYLLGLIGVLHYAEHTMANLRDAYGLLCNVVTVVIADGKVTKKEMKRLLLTAEELYDALYNVFAQSQKFQLDVTLCNRLQLQSWSESFGEFGLVEASQENINDWLNVIEDWVNYTIYPLSLLSNEALEQLLASELVVNRYFYQQQSPVDTAPSPSVIPSKYQVLPVDQERNRLKLTWWDRLYTGDGLYWGAVRLSFAAAMVGSVVFFGSRVGLNSDVSIYNGLSIPVQVVMPNNTVQVAPVSAITLDTELGDNPIIETSTLQHEIIEHFAPPMQGRGQHYVYNVAGATLLGEETVVYGTATPIPYRFLGIERWFTSASSIFFTEPPEEVKTKSGSATRTVINAVGSMRSKGVINQLNDDERIHVVLVRAKWDTGNAENAKFWQSVKSFMEADPKMIAFKAHIEKEQTKIAKEQEKPIPIQSSEPNYWQLFLGEYNHLVSGLKETLQ
jgi:Zn-dependent protease with chaperone function